MSFQPKTSELKEQLMKDDFERKILITLDRQRNKFTLDVDLINDDYQSEDVA